MTNCLCCDRDAGYRYCCHTCVRTMVRWLRDIEDYAVVLHITAAPLRGPQNGSIGAAFGPRLPIREDVATFLDFRSGAGAAVHRLRDPRDMDDNPVRSLPGSIHGIASWLRDELDQSQPDTWTLVTELHYLASHIDGCAVSNWIRELYDDIRELHETARRLAHDSPPGSLGECLVVGCGGLVYPVTLDRGKSTEREGARCLNSTCHRVYDGLDLVRLGVAQGASLDKQT